DWSSDLCSSHLLSTALPVPGAPLLTIQLLQSTHSLPMQVSALLLLLLPLLLRTTLHRHSMPSVRSATVLLSPRCQLLLSTALPVPGAPLLTIQLLQSTHSLPMQVSSLLLLLLPLLLRTTVHRHSMPSVRSATVLL